MFASVGTRAYNAKYLVLSSIVAKACTIFEMHGFFEYPFRMQNLAASLSIKKTTCLSTDGKGLELTNELLLSLSYDAGNEGTVQTPPAQRRISPDEETKTAPKPPVQASFSEAASVKT